MASVFIRPRLDIRNRQFKRNFTAQAKVVLAQLMAIDSAFLDALFDDTDKRSYKALYDHFLEQWNNTCAWLIRTNRATYCEINVAFFINAYKPIENE